MTTYYKVLRDGQSCHGGDFDWADYLPTGKRPGKWTPAIADVSACSRGYHGCTADQLRGWLDGGNQLWECEYRAEPSYHGDKVVGAQMRLVRRVGHGEVVGDITVAFEKSPLIVVKSGLCWAYGSSTVEAYGSSTVRAYDSSTVRAYGSSTVVKPAWYGNKAAVTTKDAAVLVDRTGKTLTVRSAADVTVEKVKP